MGLQPQEQVVLPTTLLFVQAATLAGASTDLLARPTAALVPMVSQPQGQGVLQAMLQFAQAAMQDFISVVLLARLAQQDASHAQVPKFALAAVRATSFQIPHARHAQPDVQHA
jgi:hypothetical protein